MRTTLTSMFAGMFRKQGFEVTEYNVLSVVEFENFAMWGMIYFDKKKYHRVKWKMKNKYILFDVPVCEGFISSEFKKVEDLFNFLQRRLIWKKKY